jgi:probable HAF family extracellular repeat protein
MQPSNARALPFVARLLSVCLVAGIACAGVASATTYRIVELPLPPEATRGHALGINASGDVVGSVDASWNHRDHAVIWDAPSHEARLLPDEAAQTRSSRATAINDRGDIIGEVEFRKVYRTHVVTWRRTGDPVPLKVWPGREWATAWDINGAGLVVGQFAAGEQTFAGPVAWPTPDRMLWLGSANPGLREGNAYAVNDAGTIVGTARADGVWHAFRWSSRSGLEYLSPSASSSSASDINDAGEAVGGVGGRAILWNVHGLPIDLGDLPGGGSDYLQADRINNLGMVIGRAQGSGGHFLWTAASGIVRIADAIDPTDPWHARLKSGDANLYVYDLNDAGVIVGVLSGAAFELPVLLVPQPECPSPAACRGPVVPDSAGRIGVRR